MSFVSIKAEVYDIVDSYYTIVDSDFGEIEIKDWAYCAAIIQLYSTRNLPIGKNLALATIYWSKLYWSNDIERLIFWQNEVCPQYIPNWAQYAKEQNEYLEKMLPLL